jgi:hypothetical protein
MSKAILTGTFTSDGNDHVLETGVECQWIKVWNQTQADADTINEAYKFEWTSDMGTTSYMTYHPANDATAANGFATTGITQVDTFNYAIGAAVATTASSNAAAVEVLTGDTTGLSNGAIVRLSNTAQYNMHGMDFSIDTLVANTSFELANTLANAPGAVGGAGFYRLIAPNRAVYDIIFPAGRDIVEITSTNPAVVTTSVDHGYSVGQLMRIQVPSTGGMIEMNGLTGTITAVTAGTFTIDIDASAFSNFVFPVTDGVIVSEFSRAQAIPIGDTLTLGFDGATRNTSFRGFVLSAGALLPAGQNGDTIYWKAGKSASVV